MDLINDIKNKIRFRNKKIFKIAYKEFSKNEKDDSHNDYPTKKEFEEHKRQIQRNELKSDRFQNVENFLNEYYKRENKELEKILFKIVGTYGLEDHLINKGFNEKRIYKIKRYNELKEFMNSLTQDQINSNLYLKAASIFMETSIEDDNLIIKQLQEQISNLKLSYENQEIELNINIPKERLELFPTGIDEQVAIPYYRPQDYKVEYVDVLDEENLYKYVEYNKYVRNINKLATDIYQLQMWNLLSVYPEQINNYYFCISNNEYEHQFITAYFVKKCREKSIVKSENEPYKLSEKTKDNISKVIGLPFDKIVNMDLEDLEKHIEQKIEKNISDPRLVLKRKNISDSK